MAHVSQPFKRAGLLLVMGASLCAAGLMVLAWLHRQDRVEAMTQAAREAVGWSLPVDSSADVVDRADAQPSPSPMGGQR